jgi:hypothetical protein
MYNWARNIVLFLVIGNLVSCQSQPFELEEPNDLVPRDTMIMVLKDLSLIEAHLQTEYVQLSNYYRSLKLSGDAILQKYHLSTSRVEESLVYYGSNHTEMQEMYTEILDTLNVQAIKIQKANPSAVQSNNVAPIPNVKR